MIRHFTISLLCCRYFTERFPLLLMTAYAFILHTCAAEAAFRTFFPAAAHSFPFCAHMLTAALNNLQIGFQQPATHPPSSEVSTPKACQVMHAQTLIARFTARFGGTTKVLAKSMPKHLGEFHCALPVTSNLPIFERLALRYVSYMS